MASGTIATPQFTKTLTITVTVTLQDADQIALSNDGTTFGAWQAATNNGTVQHTITSGDGQKTVHAKFRQSPAGAESAVVTAQTTLDTVPPIASLVINQGAPVTASPSVVLSVIATDPAAPVLVRFKNETGSFGAAESVAPQKSWTLTSGDGAKVVTMQAEDAAGNQITVNASIWLAATGASKWVILKTPDYDDTAAGVQTSYLRQGAANSSEESDLLSSHAGTPFSNFARSTVDGVTKTFDGWFEYTDGTRTDVVRGARVEITGGPKSTYVVGDQKTEVLGTRVETIGGEYRLNIGGGTLRTFNADPIFWMQFKKGPKAAGQDSWRQTIKTHTSADTYAFGDVENFFGGYKFDGTFGLTSSIFVGGKLDLSLAVAGAASLGYNFTYTKSVNLAAVDGKDLKTVGKHDTKARHSIRLRVQGRHPLGDPQYKKLFMSLGAVGLGSIGTIIAVMKGPVDGDSTTTDQDGVQSDSATTGLSIAAASFGVGLIASVLLSLRESANAAVPVPEPPVQLKMTRAGAHLAQHDGAGTMQGLIHVGNVANAPAGAPGQIHLGNNGGCHLYMQPNGSLRCTAPNYVLMGAADQSAGIRIEPNTIRMAMTQLEVNGNNVNINNVFQIVAPPPAPPLAVLGAPLAPPPPAVLMPADVIGNDDL